MTVFRKLLKVNSIDFPIDTNPPFLVLCPNFLLHCCCQETSNMPNTLALSLEHSHADSPKRVKCELMTKRQKENFLFGLSSRFAVVKCRLEK